MQTATMENEEPLETRALVCPECAEVSLFFIFVRRDFDFYDCKECRCEVWFDSRTEKVYRRKDRLEELHKNHFPLIDVEAE